MSRGGGGGAGGGGGGGGGGSLSVRWAQMAQQKEVIEERKKLYLAKQAKENGAAESSSSLNAFSNDGSFLDKFKKLSETKSTKKPPNKINLNSAKIKSEIERRNAEKRSDEDDRDRTRQNRRRDRDRSESPSRGRDRKYDKRYKYDKTNRDRNRWEPAGRNGRKRSYSPCTPIVEDMPHRKPSRFANILPASGPSLPIQPVSNFAPPKPPQSNIRFNMPGLMDNFCSAPPNPPPNIMHYIPPRVPPPNLSVPPPAIDSNLNQIIAPSVPPPNTLLHPPVAPPMIPPYFPHQNVMNDLFIKGGYPPPMIPPPMPPHAVPEPKPSDTLMIPHPMPLDAISIPKPEPLDAITIPPPKPMNLHAIPPPSPICLTQIPKPKELDLRSIPHPPASNVLSTDGSLSTAMEATAKQVAQNGDAWELTLKSQSARADSMWFLRDEQSPEYKYYRSLVLKYRTRNDQHKIDEEDLHNSVPPGEKYEPEFSLQDDSSSDESENEKPSGNVAPVKLCFEKSKIEPKEINIDISKKIIEQLNYKSDSDEDTKKKEKIKKRRSRWGDTSELTNLVTLPIPGVASVKNLGMLNANNPQSSILNFTKMTRQDPGLLQYAIKTFGNTNLSDEDWKKCEDHYKISILYQEMLQKRNEIEKLKASGRFKYEYDSDEEVDDTGTWEHKLRQQEMEATQRWACELTRQATGKHHIGDFLPPDELKRFMDKYSSVKSGKEPDLSDYKEYKLKEDNIGFKMLQKLGWSEGEGLGADRTGIVEPVNKGTQNDSNHGLGVERVDNLAEGDDEFDAYRKRMMLAYRFRPNPLNNPRRPYY